MKLELVESEGLLCAAVRRLARPEGFEPPTPRSVVWCSVQLSYGRVCFANLRLWFDKLTTLRKPEGQISDRKTSET